MNTLKTSLSVRMMATTLAFAPGIDLDPAAFSGPASGLPRIETGIQLNHARELLHAHDLGGLLLNARSDMRPLVLAAVAASLAPHNQEHAFEIARAVIEEGNRQNLDPFFLLAVIKTESRFDLNVIGRHGEIGLMQILPKTAQWLAPRAGLKTELDLRDIATNVRLGAAYFAELRRSFHGHADRYVGAYNMGKTNVRRLIKLQVEPHIYSGKVISNYQGYYASAGRSLGQETMVAFDPE